MTTHVDTTTHAEPCPGCDQADGTHWVDSTPDTDTWACRHCGTEWTIAVHIPSGSRG
jgi:ribosomal protein L37AE/L43A